MSRCPARHTDRVQLVVFNDNPFWLQLVLVLWLITDENSVSEMRRCPILYRLWEFFSSGNVGEIAAWKVC